nr:spidroin-1-like [Rhipicephalus microplus]
MKGDERFNSDAKPEREPMKGDGGSIVMPTLSNGLGTAISGLTSGLSAYANSRMMYGAMQGGYGGYGYGGYGAAAANSGTAGAASAASTANATATSADLGKPDAVSTPASSTPVESAAAAAS